MNLGTQAAKLRLSCSTQLLYICIICIYSVYNDNTINMVDKSHFLKMPNSISDPTADIMEEEAESDFKKDFQFVVEGVMLVSCSC